MNPARFQIRLVENDPKLEGILYASLHEEHIDLACQLDEGTPAQLLGDITRLRQVLVNLVGNAVKFTQAGEVVVEIRAGPPLENSPLPTLYFSVRDTGIGISADRLHRLFHSFSQTDSSITREYGGTGLGLAISKGLVELMGGRIWAERAPGAGSVFHFILPVQALPETTPPAWTGAQTLVLLAGETFDLAMLDLTLPEMDGVALANEIRQRPGTRALPLILLTSLRVRSNLPGLNEAAFSSWLTKPVKPAQLHEQLTQVLSGGPPAPRPPEKTPAPAGSKIDAQLASRMPLRILLTDDNLINQKVATRMLAQLGYKADVAGNGQEALTAAGCQFYDLILMNVQMPHMDGLEATRRLREFQGKKGGHASVVIAMTANAMTGDREKCLAAGMGEYIPKPVRPERLQSAIERFTARFTGGDHEAPAPLPGSAPPAGPKPVPVSAPKRNVRWTWTASMNFPGARTKISLNSSTCFSSKPPNRSIR
ncbi:MAG: response regulator [Pedosphaera sp.]|nr:response regulator [Pedosphaera sp.]